MFLDPQTTDTMSTISMLWASLFGRIVGLRFGGGNKKEELVLLVQTANQEGVEIYWGCR